MTYNIQNTTGFSKIRPIIEELNTAYTYIDTIVVAYNHIFLCLLGRKPFYCQVLKTIDDIVSREKKRSISWLYVPTFSIMMW